MNFLAHIYLSFEDPEITIGNFVADSVKGDGLPHHSSRIKTGIALHRAIDDFTDHHPVTSRSKARLFGKYRHYSSVLIDIFYDHFLARSWSDWHDEPLADYAQRHYDFFADRKADLPRQVQHMLPYMVQYDWLTNYQYFEGMQRVLNGMSRRASFKSKMEQAVAELKEHHAAFEADFQEFFPELITFSKEKTQALIDLEQ
ncbi:MAG: DUF479 domain-containing protein [Flavobacteriia bacterium]|nr:DUF479 domain-containing protein [Flavobacteriia bacterium]